MDIDALERNLYLYKARCHKVVDGDTVVLDVDLGLDTIRRTSFRLYDIDAAEIHGVKKDSTELEKGLRAGTEVARLLRPTKLGRILTKHVNPDVYRGAQTALWVETKRGRKGKYGRYLAHVWYVVDDEAVSLTNHLIENGFVVRAAY